MLEELQIKKLALVEDVSLEWQKGLNILTGETGAGKTIIITAVNLLLGERAGSEFVRTGSLQAQIIGLFRFENNEGMLEKLRFRGVLNDEENELILSRVIFAEGKSKCYINGRLAALSELAEIGEVLIDLHGQHLHQSLLKTPLHIEYLDKYGGIQLLSCREKYKKIYDELENLKEELAQLNMDESERLKKEDLLKFQVDEIEKANLKSNEDEFLLKEREILRNAEKIFEKGSFSCDCLAASGEAMSKGVVDLLNEAVYSLKNVSNIDPELAEINEKLSEVLFETEECESKLRNYLERIDFSKERLEEVESRLAV
ncbi:MAG: hypothetical protein Q8M92_08860, partial [Candidatus Subteraquimicrobiales bacterium]|nr:hypothetical protein [Candidatus Subteraquimicrobiales bacterium]